MSGTGAAPIDINSVIDQAAQQNNVDPNLIRSVIQTESNWNPKAVSKAGAIGLGQIMPQTAAALGIDPTDPVQNIQGTARVLAQNLDKFGNVPDALRAYNGGWDPSRWSNPETQAYVGKVASAYNSLGGGSAPSDPLAGQQTAQAGASDVPLTSSNPSAALFHQAFPGLTNASGGGSSSAPSAPSSADLFNQAFPGLTSGTSAPSSSDPEAPKPPGFWDNMVQGLEHGVSPSGAVGTALNKAAQWGDANIPFARELDNSIGRTGAVNDQAVAGSQAGAAAYAQTPAAKSWGGTIGNDIATGALTLPLAEAVPAVGAAALGPVAEGVADASPLLARGINAARTLMTGGGTNLAGKAISLGTSSALKGAIANTQAGGDPLTGAGYGLAGAPIAAVLPSVGKFVGRTVSKGVNSLLDALDANAPEAVAANAAANPLIPTPEGASAPGAGPGASTAGAAPEVPTTDPEGMPPPPPQAISPSLTKSIPNPGIALTAASADAKANKIIATYASGGPTDVNANPLVPGSKPTLAQATNNPGLAVLERTIMNDPRASNLMQARINDTNTANSQAMIGVAGTPDDIAAAEAARDTATAANREAAFTDAQPVDAQPVVDQLDALIEKNKGNPSIVGGLQDVRNQIVTRVPDPTVDPATGQPTPNAMMDKPLADPEQLYNVRQYINWLVSPKAQNVNGQAAARALLQVKPVLDDTIEAGAPGFKNYIQQYDQMSRPINSMEYLQGMNLADAQGNITLGKLNNAIVSLTKQQNLPGARAADSVTPEQFQALTTLRDSMRRANLTSYNAKAYGSPTAQNLGSNALLNALTGKVGSAASGLLGAVGGTDALGPVVGMAAGGLSAAATHGAGKLAARSNDLITQALVNKLLNPETIPPSVFQSSR